MHRRYLVQVVILGLMLFVLLGSPSAQITFERTYGGGLRDVGWSAQETEDGGYVVVGWTESFGVGLRNVYIVKIDSLGNALWTSTFGGFNYEEGSSVQQTQDGGYIVAGWATSFSAGDQDVYLVKTNENGLTGINEGLSRPSISDFCLLQNSPNPFQHSTAVSYSVPQATHITLSIYDITGRLVETLVSETQGPGIHQVRCGSGNIPSGVYLYSLRAEEFVETRKMVFVD